MIDYAALCRLRAMTPEDRAKATQAIEEAFKQIEEATSAILENTKVEGFTDEQNQELYSIALTATDGDQAWGLYQQYLKEEGYDNKRAGI